MSKRTWLADKVEQTSIGPLLLALRRWMPSRWLPVLTFHRVRDDRLAEPSRFDDDVYDVTCAALERDVAMIRKHFEPISLADLVRFVDGQPLPPNPVLVTFDDGYRDNYEIALPILVRHNVRATFFIATHYVDDRRMFWWDRIGYLVKTTPRARLSLTYPSARTFDVASSADRTRTVSELLQIVKTWFGLDLPRFLAELAEACDVTFTDGIERVYADEHVMTWNHVRGLRDAGMDVGSHTHTHRVLHTLCDDEIWGELRRSRQLLERELRDEITAVSYPVGYDLADRDQVRKLARGAGYRLGFTNGTGAQPLHRGFDPFAVRRISTDRNTPASLFSATLAAPAVFARPRSRTA
jgi:peptidoglycan/xylan/chitin deacetylase (PgdA/CDA1 family)